MPIKSNNLYKKIEALVKIKPSFGDELTDDQKRIVKSALDHIEKDLKLERKKLSYKAKINPFNEEVIKSIDAISYNTINIRHIKRKLGIKTGIGHKTAIDE